MKGIPSSEGCRWSMCHFCIFSKALSFLKSPSFFFSLNFLFLFFHFFIMTFHFHMPTHIFLLLEWGETHLYLLHQQCCPCPYALERVYFFILFLFHLGNYSEAQYKKKLFGASGNIYWILSNKDLALTHTDSRTKRKTVLLVLHHHHWQMKASDADRWQNPSDSVMTLNMCEKRSKDNISRPCCLS